MSGSDQSRKKYNARTILSQNVDPAISDGQLNVGKFIEAREYEIGQMESAMKRSRYAAKKRAFQSLPRFLRRRTASHNVKRVPKRIREQAKAEMDLVTGSKKGRRGHERVKQMAIERALQKQKQQSLELKESSEDMDLDSLYSADNLAPFDNTGINEMAEPPVSTNVKYAKRQTAKTWLPTHVWQAKRAHMINKWGYSIADTPNEKVYRAAHRISTAGSAIAWDTSYYGTIVLSGETHELKQAVFNLTGCKSSIASTVLKGTKCWDGVAVDRTLGPILLVWSNDATSVLLSLHPSIFQTAYDLISTYKDDENASFEIHDCRYSIGSISIAGSKALFALTNILHLKSSTGTTAPVELLRHLQSVANPSSLPHNVCMSFETEDPRFYAPHHVKGISKDYESISLHKWPYGDTADHVLLLQECRARSYINQSSIKSLNDRRSQTAAGEPIQATDKDPNVPAMVCKRSDDSLLLLLPWKWVLPFWFSLVHINQVRIGGLQQMHQLAFEHGKPFFPNDFADKVAGSECEVERSEITMEAWKRKPIGKRINYAPLPGRTSYFHEVGNFSCCDWKYLADLKGAKPEELILSQVSLRCVGRGTPRDTARVYLMPEGDKEFWLSAASNREEIADSDKAKRWPAPEYLVGFVTTGSFSLKDGAGCCIANLLTESLEASTKLNSRPHFLIRNVGSALSMLVTKNA